MSDRNGGSGTPDRMPLREPRDCAFITLSEALTWIAFKDAMTPDELRASLEGDQHPSPDSNEERLRKFFSTDDNHMSTGPGKGHFSDRDRGIDLLESAWQNLQDAADLAIIKARGRYTPKYSFAEASLADTIELTGHQFRTFSQFDVSTGGIRRRPKGSPNVLWQQHPDSFNREFASFSGDANARDGFLSVEVERASIMSLAPSCKLGRAPAIKTSKPPSRTSIMTKADEMKARGFDGRTIAKEMRHEPGFENVATTEVREIIKGRWKPTGRPKKRST
ncbi:hypothetical protein CP98_05066 [Sphingobium yanoikuyae]|uniref:Uncharacterized protein n=1 Tax=Sphingobium yanoikuyae TaxID=13690 RepID=A0A084E4H6_SPHYA|nr:hypothetical protein [Sphingobium yanoikuyae]KEZ12868.1 hypothetical protein CP98_05066 [Sphingobium yanoikuyae]